MLAILVPPVDVGPDRDRGRGGARRRGHRQAGAGDGDVLRRRAAGVGRRPVLPVAGQRRAGARPRRRVRRVPLPAARPVPDAAAGRHRGGPRRRHRGAGHGSSRASTASRSTPPSRCARRTRRSPRRSALGWPVALKATAPRLPAPSRAARRPARPRRRGRSCGPRSTRCPGCADPELVVQRMAPPGVAVTVGAVEDPVFGPLVSFGVAGVATDLLGDRAYRILPLSDLDAAELVRSVRAAPLLFGYRAGPPVDVAALENSCCGWPGWPTSSRRSAPTVGPRRNPTRLVGAGPGGRGQGRAARAVRTSQPHPRGAARGRRPAAHPLTRPAPGSCCRIRPTERAVESTHRRSRAPGHTSRTLHAVRGPWAPEPRSRPVRGSRHRARTARGPAMGARNQAARRSGEPG